MMEVAQQRAAHDVVLPAQYNVRNSEAYSAVSRILDAGPFPRAQAHEGESFSQVCSQVNTDLAGLCRQMKKSLVIEEPASRGGGGDYGMSEQPNFYKHDRAAPTFYQSYEQGGAGRMDGRLPRQNSENRLPTLQEHTSARGVLPDIHRFQNGQENSQQSGGERRGGEQVHVSMDAQAYEQKLAATRAERRSHRQVASVAEQVYQHDAWVSAKVERLLKDLKDMQEQIEPRMRQGSSILELQNRVDLLEQRTGLSRRATAFSNPHFRSEELPEKEDMWREAEKPIAKSADPAVPGVIAQQKRERERRARGGAGGRGEQEEEEVWDRARWEGGYGAKGQIGKEDKGGGYGGREGKEDKGGGHGGREGKEDKGGGYGGREREGGGGARRSGAEKGYAGGARAERVKEDKGGGYGGRNRGGGKEEPAGGYGGRDRGGGRRVGAGQKGEEVKRGVEGYGGGKEKVEEKGGEKRRGGGVEKGARGGGGVGVEKVERGRRGGGGYGNKGRSASPEPVMQRSPRSKQLRRVA